MIIDKLDKWKCYSFGPAWNQAIEFLASLSPDSEEKKYELQGKDIFAEVMRYETRSKDISVFETHRKYVDVQAVLSGREKIEIISRDELIVDTAYDESKDAELYKRISGQTQIELSPGTFALFFPHDAHMPCLMAGNTAESVKKVVVKIKKELLFINQPI